ncbi:DUF2269 family protein [Dankookia sp. P2]|uniref:DUF2269 family protein n=1 Tax=Dankookia sp. P2 TaxID=3423955 RepID=UPI003D677FE5
MSYEFWKLIHLSGMVLLVGNVTVTSIWKLYADRTRDARIIGFAQRLVTVTDWFFTFWGIVLLVVGASPRPGWRAWTRCATTGWSGRKCSSSLLE